MESLVRNRKVHLTRAVRILQVKDPAVRPEPRPLHPAQPGERRQVPHFGKSPIRDMLFNIYWPGLHHLPRHREGEQEPRVHHPHGRVEGARGVSGS